VGLCLCLPCAVVVIYICSRIYFFLLFFCFDLYNAEVIIGFNSQEDDEGHVSVFSTMHTQRVASPHSTDNTHRQRPPLDTYHQQYQVLRRAETKPPGQPGPVLVGYFVQGASACAEHWAYIRHQQLQQQQQQQPRPQLYVGVVYDYRRSTPQ